jgi:hypothetical protein
MVQMVELLRGGGGGVVEFKVNYQGSDITHSALYKWI